ncbi:MAG: metallophosphoesterase family protein [Planctomycetota bacterium]
MSKHAIISDIHGNLEALQAVLADIDSVDIRRIVCLGDLVGYGPNPVECLQTLERYRVTILGNHELALTEGGQRFNARARRAIEWTAKELQSTEEGKDLFAQASAFPRSHQQDGILYVHGSPCDPTNEYLLPKKASQPDLLLPQFEKFDRYCFVGHTHLPGVFEPGRRFEKPEEMLMNIFMLDADSKAIVNVGSVGQPRDRNPDACYVLFDGDSVVFRRVAYDVKKTAKKIKANPMLDDWLGDRLLEGR